MPRLTVGCVMVIANGERYLREQLESMVAQTTPLDEIVVVDDHSTDKSAQLVEDVLSSHGCDFRVVQAPSAEPRASLHTRIAQNFAFGISLIRTDIVLLADQDDVWYPQRVAMQSAPFTRIPKCAMVAHDSDLIDGASRRTGSTSSEVFSAPRSWDSMSGRAQQRFLLARPVVTGAASAVMPARMPGGGRVPRGWLHDRWYSLAAVSIGGLCLIREPVLQYRIHSRQVVGVNGAGTGRATAARRIATPTLAGKKFLDLTMLAMHNRDLTSPFIFPMAIPSMLGHVEGKRHG